jgi:ATP-binding cassette subfamily B protein
MKTLLKYLIPFRRKMTLGLTIKILGTVVELFLPYILSHILKTVVLEQSITKILFWGLLMILICFVIMGC